MSEYANEITKENLYAAYKKLHGRYHKHKFKYTELADKFKQTVTIHDKDKVIYIKICTCIFCFIILSFFIYILFLDYYDKGSR